MSHTVRIVRHSEFGDPGSVLHLLQAAPEHPAPDEVIVRMEAAALHIADLRTITGVDDSFRFSLPRTPGFEGIGHVVRRGAQVRQFELGERVFPALGSGTFRDEVRCKAADCLPAPKGDAAQLALLTVNGPTAEVLVEDFVDFAPGDWLIQNAANASCGRYVIRLAARKGVRTVSVVRRPELIAELRALGCDVVLLDGPDLAGRVAQATGGALIRLGIDAVAGVATQHLAECLAPGSTVVCYGAMSNQRCELDFYLMFRKDIRLLGLSFVRQLRLHRTPAQVREMYTRLAALMSSGELIARIAGVYPLEQVAQACAHAARTGDDREGKIILRINPA